ncbi:hypothetical protein NHH03_13510 [Stieleria sp. TO1_6]|uniref:hypothetical protein n=1 Tax=Stieleria tagensis TaxID=2956795 RepID=UPI00209B241B|nr:hypothetical protein [Stieleria tagensis]MCO8122759.1 hypothetical protein [Stieleria tagensis]
MKNQTLCISLLTFVCLFGFVGCKQESTSVNDPAPTGAPSADHGHATGDSHVGHGAGPHDGTVVDWGGGKFHVEFTVDHDAQQGTVYILAADELTATPIAASSIELSIVDPKMHVTLDAAPQANDPAGQSSRFTGKHEQFATVQEYAGTIAGVIDGTPYSGDFQEEPHGDHDH